ncbi:MAG: O-antigen ligase family protein [Candidatus Portnoybacteria bacterium]
MILIEKLLFYSLIFFLPFQTRKILAQWPASPVGGGDSFNEWTSVYLYLTDILILLIFALWFWRLRKQGFSKNLNWEWLDNKIRGPEFWLVIFIIVSFISLSQAGNIQLGFYQWLKLLEFVLLFFYLRFNFNSLFSLKCLFQILVASGFIQSIIALSQFINQRSLGLTILRESPLGINIDGVAKIATNGFKMIRAYGGLPHPNLLAVFLFVCLFSLIYLWLNKKHSFRNYIILSIVFFFFFFGLFLTFSRLIIFTFIVFSFIYLVLNFKKHKKQILVLFLLFTVHCSLFTVLAWPEISSRFQISSGEQAVGLRSFYNQTSFSVIKEHPFLGIGSGNFVWTVRQMFSLLPAWVFQPVHNIYLLIGSETGLIGLMAFLMFLFQLFRKKESGYWLLFIGYSFLFIGLFDHFFWTLQQGQLIFWLVLGLLTTIRRGV